MGILPVTSRTVDSTPTLQGPSSIIYSTLPIKSFATCKALVGLGLPERLALGAATGTLDVSINFNATGLFGIRTATVSRPAVIISGTAFDLFKIRVRGPGQNASISFLAIMGISKTKPSRLLMFEIWIIKGLSFGRPLA